MCWGESSLESQSRHDTIKAFRPKTGHKNYFRIFWISFSQARLVEIEIFMVAFSIASDFQYEKERKKGRTPMKVCLATVMMIYQLVLKQSPVKG